MKTIIFLLSIIILMGCTSEPEWEALFKKDLSNALDAQGVWYFDGEILTASEDAGIFTDSEYENFILDLEFNNETGSNSGVIVYCTDREDWIPNSVEIQIADDYHYQDRDWFPTICAAAFSGTSLLPLL